MSALLAAFGISGSLLLAQAINFAVLMVVLTYLLYKPVMKTLSERQAKVAQGVIDAERAAEKLAKADGEASSLVKKAEGDAEGIVMSAKETANAERTRIVSEADARATAIAEDAEARAKETAAKSLRESEKEVARLAVLASEKVIRDHATAEAK